MQFLKPGFSPTHPSTHHSPTPAHWSPSNFHHQIFGTHFETITHPLPAALAFLSFHHYHGLTKQSVKPGFYPTHPSICPPTYQIQVCGQQKILPLILFGTPV
jgi:hypothetical protein